MSNKHAKNSERAPKGALSEILGQTADRLLLVALLFSVCLFIVYPVFCIFLRSLQTDGGLSLEMYAKVWRDYGGSLRNSVLVGLSTAMLCTLFSAAAALALSTSRGWVRIALMGLLFMAMVSPPFISSLAYIQLYGRRGWVTFRLLGLGWNPYNALGVITMQSVSFVPLNALMLMGLVSRVDRCAVDSARDLGGGSGAVLRDVVLPAMVPGLLVSLLLSFVRSLADFGTPIIIGGRFSTIASDIYLQLVGYSDLEKASAMNMFLLLPSVAAFFVYRALMKKLNGNTDGRERRRPPELRLSKCGGAGIAACLISGLFFLMMALQYACVFLSGFIKRTKYGIVFTGEYLERLWRYDGSTMLRSVVYGLIVAALGTVFAALFAYYMDRRRVPGRGIFDCAATLPYMLPGSCFGIGYILAFNHAPLKLTGTAAIVLLNMLFKQLPTSTKICSATLARIPRTYESAAQDLGAGRLAVLRDVYLPGMKSAFISCFAYNFSSSMTTVGAIIFLIDPGRKLAVFRLFDAVYTGDYALASLIASLIIVIVLIVEALAFALTGKAGVSDAS